MIAIFINKWKSVLNESTKKCLINICAIWDSCGFFVYSNILFQFNLYLQEMFKMLEVKVEEFCEYIKYAGIFSVFS